MLTIDRFNNITINKGDEDKLLVTIEHELDLNLGGNYVCFDVVDLNIHKTVSNFVDNIAIFQFSELETINKKIGTYDYQIYVNLPSLQYKGVLHQGSFNLLRGYKHEHTDKE